MALLHKSNDVAIDFINRQSSCLETRPGNDNLLSPCLASVHAALGTHMTCPPCRKHGTFHCNNHIAKTLPLEYLLDIKERLAKERFQFPFNPICSGICYKKNRKEKDRYNVFNFHRPQYRLQKTWWGRKITLF